MQKCKDCGKQHERSSKRCRACVDKENARQRRQYQEYLANGLCPRCGKPSMDGSKHCDKCAALVRDKDRKVRSSRSDRGLCVHCGQNAPADGLKTCNTCLSSLRQLHGERIGRLMNAGLCVICGKFPQMSGLNRIGNQHDKCRTCYLKHVSRINLGSKKYAAALLAKLEAQNYKCPYTHDDLVLGDNTWLDHIMPRSRFPKLAHSIDNVEWVTETVNRMKQDQTPEEFLLLVKRILDHCGL